MWADGSVEAPEAGAPPQAGASLEVAFTRLYQEHFERVYRLLGRYGIAPHDVDDLAQQVFIVAYARRDALAELKNPHAWLAAIAVRVAHEHYRWRRVRRLKAWVVEHSWAARGADEATPEREALRSESAARVRSVLEQMSKKLRDALVLLELQGLATEEAAEILAIPPNTLRSRQRLAKESFERLWLAAEQQKERSR
ncbi:MAG TPA: RNA polymerase sigma factor [Polyangiaceae bacterium]|nr:RNA polymerase sigma factor [Polyangiaceae bacterium]